MEPQSGPFDVPGSTEGGPTISRMTRRHFLAMAGAAAGVAGIAVVLKRLTSASSRQQTSAKVRLPDMPSPNPAYRGWVTADGGLLLSTRMQHDKFLAFRLNANGR